jgi:effector-binding domain-containing protein
MFRIGDFSRLSQVSVKALRHYDEIGLLKPASVDPYTGYRTYSASQMPRLNRILALKEMGFSLEQIRQVLEEGLSAEQVRGMLRLKQAELERVLMNEQLKLKRIESKLREMEKENQMPEYDVILKKIEPIRVISVRGIIDGYQHMCDLFNVLCPYIVQNRIQPAGPAMAIYYDTEYKERDVDVEVAVPTQAEIPQNDRIQVKELPGVETMACVIHRCPYENLMEAYGALLRWIEENQYEVSGPNRDIYLKPIEPGVDPAELVTEIQFPVVKNR